MTRRVTARLALAAVLALSAPVMAGDPTTKPAAPAAGGVTLTGQPMADLQAMIDARQYPDAVKAASKLLSVKGPAAAGYSRFQVTMLKGEAQAGGKQFAAAVSTFTSAVKETQDPREIALAKWTAELFKKSSAGTYIPKAVGPGGARPAPIDLLNSATRPAAFAALLDDELAALAPKIKTAAASTSLPAIFPVIEQVVALGKLDTIANGNEDSTAKAAKGLLDHSRSLLVTAVKGMWSRVSDIEKTANQTTQTPNTVQLNGVLVQQTMTRKNGLTQQNKTELQNVIDTCGKIRDYAQMFAQTAESGQDWTGIMTDADRVSAKASEVLNADYSTTTSGGNGMTDLGNGTFTDGTTTYRRDANGNYIPVTSTNGTGGFLPGTNFPGQQTTTQVPQTPPTTPNPGGTGTTGTGGTGTGTTPGGGGTTAGGGGTTNNGGTTPAKPTKPNKPGVVKPGTAG